MCWRRMPETQGSRQFATVPVRHRVVDQHEPWQFTRIQNVQGLARAASFRHLVAKFRKYRGHETADILVVIDHQNNCVLCSLSRLQSWLYLWRGGNVLRARQIDPDRGANPQPAFDADAAARLPRNSVNLTQAEPGTSPESLGREKRFERLREHVLGHSRSGITDGKADKVARWQIETLLRHTSHIDVGSRNRQAAPGGHGIARVEGQVQDDEFNLRRVRNRGPEIALENRLDPDRRPNRSKQQIT